jgi:YVTN family beta-propeller protein
MSLRKWLNVTATIATIALTLVIGVSPATAAPVLTTPISLPKGSDPISVAFSPDGKKAYVANYDKNTVSVISVAANSVTSTISMPDKAKPYSVAFSRDGTKAYVTNNDNGTVSVISVATGKITATISLPPLSYPQSVAFSPDGTKAYVATYGSSSVSVINVANNALGTPIVLPGGVLPKSVAFSPDGTKAYVASYFPSNVSVISVASGTVTSTISLPANSYPTSIAFSPDGAKAYVSHYRRSSVSVITVASGSVTSTNSLPTGYQWDSVAFSPDGKQAFVTGFNWTTLGGTVAMITVASDTVTSEILLPSSGRLKSVAFSPDGTKAYVGDSGTATVSVISLTPPLITAAPTPTISGTVKFGNTLTATPGTAPAGATVKSYQWSRATTATGVFTNITDATASTYALTASDVARFIRVTVTWQKSDYNDTPKASATTVVVAAGTFATPPVPTITGTKAVGQTLTANPGTWTPAVDTSTFTWSRATKATSKYTTIAGATTSTYTLQSADLGKFIKVTVTGTKAGYTTITSGLSAATTVIVAG